MSQTWFFYGWPFFKNELNGWVFFTFFFFALSPQRRLLGKERVPHFKTWIPHPTRFCWGAKNVPIIDMAYIYPFGSGAIRRAISRKRYSKGKRYSKNRRDRGSDNCHLKCNENSVTFDPSTNCKCNTNREDNTKKMFIQTAWLQL